MATRKKKTESLPAIPSEAVLSLDTSIEFIIGAEIPPAARNSKRIKFNPKPFVVENPYVEKKFVNAEAQKYSLQSFLADPCAPVIYGVGSSPDDTTALQFCNYLLQVWVDHPNHSGKVSWIHSARLTDRRLNEHVLGPHFDKESESDLGFLVVWGLSPLSTPQRIEAVRDLIDKYRSRCPVVVVTSGVDPIDFFTSKLMLPLTKVFYHFNSFVKRPA